MTDTPISLSQATIAVIGAGRLGGVLARALRAAGFTVHGPLTRDDKQPRVDIAVLAVADTALTEAAVVARKAATIVGHLSGATTLARVDFSMHPLQTFTGDEAPRVFHDIGMAIAGRTAEHFELARHLATALGARPFAVDDGARASYHAAASFASNFVLTVLDTAEQLAVNAGLSAVDARAYLAPLAHQSIDNWQRLGAPLALTGPIARGDQATVARQRAALTDDAARDLFDALAASTGALAASTPALAAEKSGS